MSKDRATCTANSAILRQGCILKSVLFICSVVGIGSKLKTRESSASCIGLQGEYRMLRNTDRLIYGEGQRATVSQTHVLPLAFAIYYTYM